MEEDIRQAVEQGASFFVATVKDVSAEKAGTRSATAVYELAVEAAIRGPLPAAARAKHLGKPLLAAGQRAVIAALDSGRFHDAWQLVGHWPVQAGAASPEAVAGAFAAERGWTRKTP